jgi:hypothetical protein
MFHPLSVLTALHVPVKRPNGIHDLYLLRNDSSSYLQGGLTSDKLHPKKLIPNFFYLECRLAHGHGTVEQDSCREAIKPSPQESQTAEEKFHSSLYFYQAL